MRVGVMMLKLLLAATLVSCIPLQRPPEPGPRVRIGLLPKIPGQDVGFAAGLLAERGFTVALASRDANVVNTAWRSFLINGADGILEAQDRIQVSATADGIIVQYASQCLNSEPVVVDYYTSLQVREFWGACREIRPDSTMVATALQTRYDEIWAAIRAAAK